MEFPLILTSLAYRVLERWPVGLIASLCFLCLTWYLRHKNQAFVNWPILRNLPCLLLNATRLNDWLVDSFNENGLTVVIKGPVLTGLEIVVTCDPNNIEYLTKTNFTNFPKGSKFMEIFNVLGDGIFNVDSEKWRIQRKMAHVRFGLKEFRSFYADVSQKAVQEGLLPVLAHIARQERNVDLQDVLMRFSFDTTVASIFGRNPKSLSIEFPKNEFANAVDEANNAILYRIITPSTWWKFLRFLCIGKERNMANAWRTADQVIQGYISLLRKDGKGNDLLSTYMNPSEEEKEEARVLLSKGDEFLRDTTLTLLTAGRDTVSLGLTWFFLLISKTPRVEEKILEELMSVEKKRDDPKSPWLFDSKDLRGLVYLHAALLEAMRLYPPVPNDFKSVLEKDELPDGTIVKPGMKVAYSIYAVGRMKLVWGEDCLEFKPERWIDENGKLRHESAFKYPVFNAGPRTCIGKDMALTMMKVAAAAILFNFHVQVVEGHPVVWKPSTTLTMEYGLKVKIKGRLTN